MTRKQQLVVLALLLAALAFVALRPGSGGRTRAAGSRAGGPGAAGSALGDVTPLRLAELEQKPGDYSPGRDPFRFEVPKPDNTAREAAARARRQRRQVAEAKPPPPPPPPAPRATAPPRPRPPAIDFKFLGSFGPKDMKIAVFTDASDIYNARAGEVIKDRFVVQQIGYETADIGFVGFPDEPPQRLEAGG